MYNLPLPVLLLQYLPYPRSDHLSNPFHILQLFGRGICQPSSAPLLLHHSADAQDVDISVPPHRYLLDPGIEAPEDAEHLGRLFPCDEQDAPPELLNPCLADGSFRDSLIVLPIER